MAAIARFKDICIDANDSARLGRFWAEVIGRHYEAKTDGGAVLTGPTSRHTVWVNAVPEPRPGKNRVHLDIYATALTGLEELGARITEPEGEDRKWTVMADVEGGEFCAFLRADLPAELLHGLVVDSADPAAQARWWGSVYDAEVVHYAAEHSTVRGIAGMPILTMDFVAVPEPKTVKNRVHWDVSIDRLEPLVGAGATTLRPPDQERNWYVMADPEGNEFCAFVKTGS
ncbi:MAG: VOC family protein [Acidimicrobiales bacterium]